MKRATTAFTTSKDGTKIAYETAGDGPPLVIVWGALGLRASPFAKAMRDELAKSFSVYDYDRRGRGESGDTQPYSVAAEVEDLRAVCLAAGGRPWVWATSSGAALALEAAAAGVPMQRLAAHEPPYAVGEHTGAFDREYPRKVADLVRADRREDAVRLFMRTVGVPAPFVWLMRFMNFWKSAVAAANTLPYDAACVNAFELPTERFRSITTPTVILAGGATPASLKRAAEEVSKTVPGATLRVVPKQNHGIKPASLRPVLVELFS